MQTHTQFKKITDEDRENLKEFIRKSWGSDRMVSRNRLYYPWSHEGFLVTQGETITGLITYEVLNREMEITLLQSATPLMGLGSSLVKMVIEVAKAMGLRRVWLITTNDNAHALRFYQKRGFNLVRLHYDAISESRKLKPEIPSKGIDGIPLRHELELEILI